MKPGGYIVSVRRWLSWYWLVDIVGVNGKRAFTSKVYRKRSYAVRQAKSFVDKVQGRVRLDV